MHPVARALQMAAQQRTNPTQAPAPMKQAARPALPAQAAMPAQNMFTGGTPGFNMRGMVPQKPAHRLPMQASRMTGPVGAFGFGSHLNNIIQMMLQRGGFFGR